jgi:hypothetical protein
VKLMLELSTLTVVFLALTCIVSFRRDLSLKRDGNHLRLCLRLQVQGISLGGTPTNLTSREYRLGRRVRWPILRLRVKEQRDRASHGHTAVWRTGPLRGARRRETTPSMIAGSTWIRWGSKVGRPRGAGSALRSVRVALKVTEVPIARCHLPHRRTLTVLPAATPSLRSGGNDRRRVAHVRVAG